jgi:hypothetical protein
MWPGRTERIWRRRGESNPRATLKTRKLLILQIARNAKTARNTFRGYAEPYKGSSSRSESWVRRNSFRIRRPINRSRGPLFSKESGSVVGGQYQFSEGKRKFHFSPGFTWASGFFMYLEAIGGRSLASDRLRWERLDCRTTTCRIRLKN